MAAGFSERGVGGLYNQPSGSFLAGVLFILCLVMRWWFIHLLSKLARLQEHWVNRLGEVKGTLFDTLLFPVYWASSTVCWET